MLPRLIASSISTILLPCGEPVAVSNIIRRMARGPAVLRIDPVDPVIRPSIRIVVRIPRPEKLL
jgi:hypothetical protein